MDSLEITFPELAYLLRCEEEFGDWTWKDTTNVNEMLYSLAVSQINLKCAFDIYLSLFLGDEDERQKAYFDRNCIHQQEKSNVWEYIAKESSRGWEGFERDVNQLKQDYTSGKIDHKDLKLWFKCFECHWKGPVHSEVPDYMKILHRARCEPGIRGPIQLRNRKELPWIYEQVKVWLEKKKVSEYSYLRSALKVQNQPQLPMINMSDQDVWSSGQMPLDIGGNLSMARN